MKLKLQLLLLICILQKVIWAQGLSQSDMEIYNKYFEVSESKYKYRLTLTSFFILNGGWGLSLGAGSWVDIKGTQPALSISINAYGKGNSLGNALFYGEDYYQRRVPRRKKGISNKDYFNPNRTLVTMVFSPLLTRRITKNSYVYDEINPFYYGSSTVIYSKYRNALTLGTSFVAMPRGTYNNIMTARNRTQQLLYFQVRVDGFQLNLYEDYFVFTELAPFQWLSDNRDRFYTGGGNIQVRLNPYLKIKVYSEMYTGTSYTDKQEYPDLAFPETQPSHMANRRRADAINRKFAYQDPGQQSFNKARNFICVDGALGAYLYSKNKSDKLWKQNYWNHQVQLIIGRQNGRKNMLQQNVIHNKNSINRDSKEKNAIRASTLHHFDYSDNFFPKTLIGIGTTTNY